MGRGRGKGKKATTGVSSHEDPGSGGEESLPAYKRRGRPQKPLKDEVEEDVEKMELEEEEEEIDVVGGGGKSKETKQPSAAAAAENVKKRRRHPQPQAKETVVSDVGGEENGEATRSGHEESVKTDNNYRQNGSSRRKSTPRRAAEAGVECK